MNDDFYYKRPRFCGAFFDVFALLTKTESLDDGTIAVDVVVVEVLQQLTTLTDEHCQRTGCVVILVILLQVLRQVRDAIAEESNLCLCRTGILCVLTILTKDLLLFGFV